ncbi:hypothetical protein ABZ806_31090 [Spirillospora sp. NPDC047418]
MTPGVCRGDSGGAGVDIAVGAVVHVSERLDAELHDLFVVFHANCREGSRWPLDVVTRM